jgi:hypothetical protein
VTWGYKGKQKIPEKVLFLQRFFMKISLFSLFPIFETIHPILE